jgi:hypothetical protein
MTTASCGVSSWGKSVSFQAQSVCPRWLNSFWSYERRLPFRADPHPAVLLERFFYRTNILYGWTGREAVFADAMINFWDEKDAEKKSEQ